MDKIKIDAFTKYKYLSNPTFSENGERFVFEVTNISEDKKSYETSLYENKDGKIKRLTTNSGSGFVFSNEDEILFKDNREKKSDSKAPSTKIYKLNLNGGEAEKILDFNMNLSLLYALEDKYIFIENYDPKWDGYNNIDENSKSEMVKINKENEDYKVFDEIPFWSNGVGVTNKMRSRLVLVNKKDNHYEKITDKYTNIDILDINKEKNKIVFVASTYKDKSPMYNKIYLYNINKNELKEITPIEDMCYQGIHFFGENILVYASDLKKHGINENCKILLFNPETKEILKENFSDLSFWSSVGSDVRHGGGTTEKVDGDYFYFTSTIKYSNELFRLNKDLEIEQLTHSMGSVDSFDIHDGKIVAVCLIDQKLQELYEIKDGNLTQISNINTELEGKYVAKPNLVEWNKNGYDYTGFVLLPPDYDENKKYPAVFEIHGGPKTVYGTVFYHEMQFLASEGYIVFFTNPRGSDGYGNEFMDIFGKYGDIDYKDLMDFTDLVLEKYPAIDKEKVFVTGGSYGGFMTNWIIGHTDRYKRACSQRSISNWISMWGTTDIGYYFADDQTRASIWNYRDDWAGVKKMWEQSPLKYADKVKTPTLFINSDEDYRCYHVEGLQMFTALKFYGIESRLVLFRGENHELSRSGLPHHRIRRLKEIRDWFSLGL